MAPHSHLQLVPYSLDIFVELPELFQHVSLSYMRGEKMGTCNTPNRATKIMHCPCCLNSSSMSAVRYVGQKMSPCNTP
eukprot:1158617-Pelagomonas_calceolata.AAC.6